MAYDTEGLFRELNASKDFILSDGPRSRHFLYGLKIIPVNPPVSLLLLLLGIVHGSIVAFIVRKYARKYHSYFYSFEGLKKIIFLFEKTEEYSANHSRNMAEISYYLGKKMNLKRKRLKDLKIAACLHDIGKISIPAEILNKNGILSKNEFSTVKNHVRFSVEIINNIESLRHLKDFILCHHEKMDGSDYPRGLTADEIPLDREILALLRDNLDEICRLITYKKNFPVGRALII